MAASSARDAPEPAASASRGAPQPASEASEFKASGQRPEAVEYLHDPVVTTFDQAGEVDPGIPLAQEGL